MNRLILVVLVAGLAAFFTGAIPSSCSTSPDGSTSVNWPRVAVEFELAAGDLTDVASLIDDPKLSSDIIKLADLLEQISAAISTGGSPETKADLLERALLVADTLVEDFPEDHQDEARAAILIARAGLRRVNAYASVPPPHPVPAVR